MHKLYRQSIFLLSTLAMLPSLTIGALAQKPIHEAPSSKPTATGAHKSIDTSAKKLDPKLDQKREQKLQTKKSLGQIKQAVLAQNHTAIPGWHEIKTLESLTPQQRTSLQTLYRPYKQKLRSLKEELQIALKEEHAGSRSNAIPNKDNKNPNITVGEAILLGSLEPEEASNDSASRITREQASNAEVKRLFERMIATKKDAWNHLQPMLTRAQIKEVTATATARMRSRSARKPQSDSKNEQESID